MLFPLAVQAGNVPGRPLSGKTREGLATLLTTIVFIDNSQDNIGHTQNGWGTVERRFRGMR